MSERTKTLIKGTIYVQTNVRDFRFLKYRFAKHGCAHIIFTNLKVKQVIDSPTHYAIIERYFLSGEVNKYIKVYDWEVESDWPQSTAERFSNMITRAINDDYNIEAILTFTHKKRGTLTYRYIHTDKKKRFINIDFNNAVNSNHV